VFAIQWLLMAWVITAQVGVVVVAWRLLIWLLCGRNPWREPPGWPWRRVRAAAAGGRARRPATDSGRLAG
jgi:hypothetical protein